MLMGWGCLQLSHPQGLSLTLVRVLGVTKRQRGVLPGWGHQRNNRKDSDKHSQLLPAPIEVTCERQRFCPATWPFSVQQGQSTDHAVPPAIHLSNSENFRLHLQTRLVPFSFLKNSIFFKLSLHSGYPGKVL